MERFLKDELDRYLRGSSSEDKKENTFINRNRPYQWYNKGSLILYGLRGFIGDSTLNKALHDFRDEYAFKPPFAGSHDLYRYIKQATPDSLQYYLKDTWEKITLYENKAEEAKAKKLGDGTYEVTLKLASQKFYADSQGMETNAKYAGDYIDTGVFAAEDTGDDGKTKTNPLFLKKYKTAPGEKTIGQC